MYTWARETESMVHVQQGTLECCCARWYEHEGNAMRARQGRTMAVALVVGSRKCALEAE